MKLLAVRFAALVCIPCLLDHVINRFRNLLEVAIHFGSMLNSIDTHNFLPVIDPINDAPVTYS